MQEDGLSESSELLSWSRRWMAPLGVWPKDNNNLRFVLSFIYILIFQVTQYADLIYGAKNGEDILLNLCESSHFTLFLIKFAVIHNNRSLAQMIDMMNEDCTDEFRSFEEQKKSVYYLVAKTLNKIARLLSSSVTILCCLRPLIEYLFTTARNGKTPFVLPFRSHIFYEMTDIYTYALTYAYQVGAIFIINLGTVSMDGLLIALTFHVCNQLSVLAESIADITKDKKNAHDLKICVMVKQHLRLIWMAKQINKELSSSFLCQVLYAGLLICLSGYQIANSFRTTRTTTLSVFLATEATMLIFLYGYCFVGETLIKESQRVRDAFYQCNWYELAPSQSKDFIICMAGSEKPLHLGAGHFFIFSLALFSEVVRTAVGYVSVLSSLV